MNSKQFRLTNFTMQIINASNYYLPGILKVFAQPSCILTMGVIAVTGELFINPLSERGVRVPLTVTLQEPDTNDIQQQPENLIIKL